MKIALLHYSSPPIVGGVESVLAHHARLMTRAGHAVTIFTGRGKAFDDRIPVHLIPRLDSRHAQVLDVKRELDQGQYTAAFDNLRDQIKLELLAALEGFDVLVAHNVASLHKNLALTAAIHAMDKMPGFPRLILWHHDLAWTAPRYLHELHAGYPWDLLRTDWGDVTHVVVSELRRQELVRLLGMDSESIHIIPNGVDVNTFYKLEMHTIQIMEQLKLRDANPLILLPARLTPRKNIELALHVLAELHREFPEAMLLVTGPEGPHNPANTAYHHKLLDLRRRLKLENSAHFLAGMTPDSVPDAVIADFYRLADALLFPSNEEGFGIPILEAAFSSIPVFCMDLPVLRELGGADVSYFDADDSPRSIAMQVTERLRSETTSRWARRAKHSFAWDSIYRLYIAPLIEKAAP